MRQKQRRLSDALREGLALARLEIRQGRFQRTMAVITAFSAIVSGFEAYVQHQRGAFANRLMWTPALIAPPTVVASLAAIVSERVARRLVPVFALLTLADGLLGFVLHLRGIRRLAGGFRLGQYNVVMGPPIFAPLLLCIVGVAGIMSGFLRRETLRWSLLRAARTQTARGNRGGVSLTSRIAHGRFQRLMAITTAAFGILAGGEAYFEHLRGSFNQRVMWTPVWVTPPLVVAAIAAAVNERLARKVLPLTASLALVDGMIGFLLHVRGIRRMPGSLANLRFNITMGPPLFAPLLLSAVGLFGLTASLLRRGRR